MQVELVLLVMVQTPQIVAVVQESGSHEKRVVVLVGEGTQNILPAHLAFEGAFQVVRVTELQI